MNLLKREIVFLSKNGMVTPATLSSSTKKDLILSPHYYWRLKEKIPIKSLSKVKKIAPQIASSKLPEGSFEYLVIPSKDVGFYEIYAFDKELIEKKLLELGIDKESIRGVSFCDIEFEGFGALRSETTILGYEDGGYFELDISLFEGEELYKEISGVLSEVSELKERIAFGKSTGVESMIDFALENSYKVATILVLLSIPLLAMFFRSYTDYSALETKHQELIAAKGEGKHSIQLDYIKKELENTDKTQGMLRGDLNKIFGLKGDNTKFIQAIDYDPKSGVVISIKAKDKATAEAFISSLPYTFATQNKDIFIFEAKK